MSNESGKMLTHKSTPKRLSINSLSMSFASYFGKERKGIDLLRSLRQLPLNQINKLKQVIDNRHQESRVFFMGNGGSFDNARLMAQLCRNQGIMAKTPGFSDDYFITAEKSGYETIYEVGLHQDILSSKDIVIGISGSGNSENILRALIYAKKQRATIFCLGGRDGGKMKKICGDSYFHSGESRFQESLSGKPSLYTVY